MDIAVDVQHVTKKYGESMALRDVSLKVVKGEFVSILGPSGCGKTTLLNIIAGFVECDEGAVFIDGKNVVNVPPYKRNAGMVFQNYALFPHMNVYDNIAFGLKIRRLTKDEISKRVKEALEAVRLSVQEKKRVFELSGGEQQRVAVARAIAIQPDVLLMDEPLSNLDAKLRIQMRVELKAIQKRIGISTIYVTHDQEEALTLSDRIAVLSPEHNMEQIGSPFELYNAPESEFIADFIGTSNFFSGKVLSTDTRSGEATVHGSRFDLCVPLQDSIRNGDNVVVAIRAERIRLSKAPQALRNAFRGTIKTLAYQGFRCVYEVSLGDQQKVIVNEFDSGAPRHIAGEDVYVGWELSDCVVIKRDSGSSESL